MLLPENCLEDLLQGLFDVHLNESELFIALVLQDFREQGDFVVAPSVGSHTVNDSSRPFNDQRLEAVLLHQVGVHELLHGFDREARLSTLCIELKLLVVNVSDNVSELLGGDNLLADSAAIVACKLSTARH